MLPVADFKCRGPYTKDFCRKSPGIGKKWHPGVLGHKLRGESMSFAFLAMLRGSVKAILAAVSRGHDPSDEGIKVSVSNKVGKLLLHAHAYLKDRGVLSEWGFKSSDITSANLQQRAISCSEQECGIPPKCFTGARLYTSACHVFLLCTSMCRF